MYFKIADLCDNNQDKKIQVLSSKFNSYGGRVGFYGQIITIKLNKSNFDLLNMLKNEKGHDKIVIVDVDAEFYGVVGDRLSAYAKNNNFKALIINGYIRDTKEIKKIDVGVLALGTCPLRCFEKTQAIRDCQLDFGGVTFNNGDYLYADEDGVILCNEKLDTENLAYIH